MAERISFQTWRYSHYFKLEKREVKNIQVTCKLCPGSKLLSTANNSNSNLLKHLEKRHATLKLTAKLASEPAESDEQEGPTPLKQQRLDFRRTYSQTEVDKKNCRVRLIFIWTSLALSSYCSKISMVQFLQILC